MPFDPSSLNLYPKDPGVYLMKDQNARILYIGKAKNLRARLRTYFGKSDERAKISLMVGQVEEIETIITSTEKDALILENNLIKRHQPKYNILLKDDKTFISLQITQHRWPMIRLVRVRGESKEKGDFFGPYTSAATARRIFDLLTRLFPLRQCSDAELASRKRPCLLYDIKRCIAPCVNKCTKEEYDRYVVAAREMLKGHHQILLSELRSEMKEASDRLEYERANSLLKIIREIEQEFSIQQIKWKGMHCDALGFFRSGDAVIFSLLQIREGAIIGSEHFSFHQVIGSDEELLSSFLLQQDRLNRSAPPEILLPFPLEENRSLQEILSESAQGRISLVFPKQGTKKEFLEMAMRNAKATFEREEETQFLHEKMLLDLQEALHLTRFPRRIECLDTSHLFGAHPVAALASYVNGKREKSRTRLFRIKSREKAGDLSAMREALYRHLLREKEQGDFCDLLIVDGGKAQLHLAQELFHELEIASIDLIALTKEEGRHDRGLNQEKIYLTHRKDPLVLDVRSPMLFLLQRIRDDTHRLAIEYHRKRQRKQIVESELDAIPGIGPVKKRALLTHFGSIRAIRSASREELTRVKGLSRRDIERIMNWMRQVDEAEKRDL